MRLITPDSLHYPITVTKLRARPDNEIAHNAPLFDYFYKSKVIEGSEDNKEGKAVERTWPSTFESYVEGTLTKWYIQEGTVISRPRYVSKFEMLSQGGDAAIRTMHIGLTSTSQDCHC